MQLGYTLSSEEFGAQALVAQAERAKRAGFSVASISASVVCGPDSERHRAAIQEYVDAGYDHVYVHRIGDDQEGFFDFYEREVMPGLGETSPPRPS